MNDLHNLLVTIGLCIISALLSGLVSFRLGLKSKRIELEWEAESNRASAIVAYISYLKGWKKEFTELIMVRHGYKRNYAGYRDELPRFVEKSSIISHLLEPNARSEFDRLVGVISESRLHGDEDKYDTLISHYDNLIKLVCSKV